MIEKRILEISPIEKKVGMTKSCASVPYWIFRSSGNASQKLDVSTTDTLNTDIFFYFFQQFSEPLGAKGVPSVAPYSSLAKKNK